jgi:hypothetical protein
MRVGNRDVDDFVNACLHGDAPTGEVSGITEPLRPRPSAQGGGSEEPLRQDRRTMRALLADACRVSGAFNAVGEPGTSLPFVGQKSARMSGVLASLGRLNGSSQTPKLRPEDETEGPRGCRGSPSGASRTRTGDLLGAIWGCSCAWKAAFSLGEPNLALFCHLAAKRG